MIQLVKISSFLSFLLCSEKAQKRLMLPSCAIENFLLPISEVIIMHSSALLSERMGIMEDTRFIHAEEILLKGS